MLEHMMMKQVVTVTGTTKGYLLGGHTGSAAVGVVNRYNFSTDAVTNLGNIGPGRWGASITQSSLYAYYGGGYDTANTTAFSKMSFQTETVASLTAVLSLAGREITGSSSLSKGYSIGGNGRGTRIDGISFSNDSAISVSDTLGTSHESCAPNSALNSDKTKGYIFGNVTASTLVTVFNHTTETDTNLATVLSAAKSRSAHSYSPTKGYALGGGSAASNDIDSIVFATDTNVNVANSLAVSIKWSGSSSSELKSIMYGCTNGAASTEIHGIDFSTDTAINPASTISSALYITLGSQV